MNASLSAEPVANFLESGEMLTENTVSVCVKVTIEGQDSVVVREQRTEYVLPIEGQDYVWVSSSR